MSLLHSAQSLLAGLLGVARTRLELFGTELQEELTRLVYVIVGAVAALLLAVLALALGAAALLFALPPELRAGAAGAMGVLILAASLVIALGARRLLMGRPRVLAATVSELARDQAALLP
jgi:uncharacterized membrane protein YqjE